MMAAQPGWPALVKTFHSEAIISRAMTAHMMVMPMAIPWRAALLGTDGALSDWKNNIASRELIDLLLLQVFRCSQSTPKLVATPAKFRAGPCSLVPVRLDF